MLKNGGPELIEVLTDIYNSFLEDGKVPEVLNKGIMNLIPKQKCALTLKQRRPLTISSVLVGIFTGRMAKMMSKVAEREGHLSDAAFGFRKSRSTVDCLFLLNTALQKAKRKKIPLNICSVDLEKAYDMVHRPYLFAKLKSLGYKGKTLSLIQSLYFNDSVQVNVNGFLTTPLFFDLGVKQGCGLSPILFSFYIDSLIRILHKNELGLG